MLAAYGLLLLRYLIEGSFAGGANGSLLTLLGLMLGGGASLGFLWTLSRRSAGRMMVERTNPLLRRELAPTPGAWWSSPASLASVALGAMTLVVGWQVADVSLRELFSSSGLRGARNIFASLLTPNWDILGMVVEKMMETIFIAFTATFIAIPLAFVLSFPSARNLMRDGKLSGAIYAVCRVLANFTRSVEPLVWAVIFCVWVGIGPFAGMLALMLHSIASLTKLYSEQIENVDNGPIEAIEATGANKLQVLWYAVVPQIMLPFLSFTIYRWDINIRMATIIGLVGGGGVGTLLMQFQGLARWNEVGTIVIVIALVVWAMDYLSARIRAAIY